jgi:hypothetical protein
MRLAAYILLLSIGTGPALADEIAQPGSFSIDESFEDKPAQAPVTPVEAVTSEPAGSCCAVEDIYSQNKIVRREQWTGTKAQAMFDDKCYNYFSLLGKAAVSPANNQAYVRAMQDVYKGGRIVIHHTASNSMSAQDVLDDHIKQDWGDMGYHFYIKKDCTVLEGRPLHMMGTHAGHMPARIGQCQRSGQASYDITNDFDFKAIGIVMEGNANGADLGAKCGGALKKLIGSLHNSFGIDRIGGHGHYRVDAHSGTECPGDHMKSWMQANLGADSGMQLEGVGDGPQSLHGLLERANGAVSLQTLQMQFTQMMGFRKAMEAGGLPAGTLPVNDLNGRSINCTACRR